MIRNARARVLQVALIFVMTTLAAPIFAQSPATPPAMPPAASSATPATPPAAAPAAPAASTPAPAVTPAAPAPAAAQTAPPAAAVQTADPFGEPTVMTPKTVVLMKGSSDWDSAFDTIQDSIKTLDTFLDKQGVKPAGPALIVYTSTDDAGCTFLAEVPVDEAPKATAKDISVGKSPEGKALKFVHHGSYDNMDDTYEAITNHLDDMKIEAKDTFIEEYVTDVIKTPEDDLVINIFVPLK